MRKCKERFHFQNQASVKPLCDVKSDRKSNADEMDFPESVHSSIVQPHYKNIYSCSCKPHNKSHKTDGNLIEKYMFIS